MLYDFEDGKELNFTPVQTFRLGRSVRPHLYMSHPSSNGHRILIRVPFHQRSSVNIWSYTTNHIEVLARSLTINAPASTCEALGLSINCSKLPIVILCPYESRGYT